MVFWHGKWAHEEHIDGGTVGVGASVVATPHTNQNHTPLSEWEMARRKGRCFGPIAETHKRHEMSTGKPVALVGGKMDWAKKKPLSHNTSLSVPKTPKRQSHLVTSTRKHLKKGIEKKKKRVKRHSLCFFFHFEFERRFSFAFSLFFFCVCVFLRGDWLIFQICKKAAMTTHQSLALGFFIAIGLVVGVCGERFEVNSA